MHPVVRILVVDDQSLVRSGICASLENSPNIQVVGQAASGKEALCLSAQLQPDILLLDLHLADVNGAHIVTALQKSAPNIKILVVTTSMDIFLIPPLFACGVRGFFNKASGHADLVEAILSIQAGSIYVCPRIAKKIHRGHENPLKNPLDALSERELQVLLLIFYGLDHEKICKKLGIRLSTLKTYRMRITEKLHHENDVELTLIGMRYGLWG
jgi:two-component system invasion response regulator UvrY